jgi:FixJ family two-component response regulator
MTKLNKPVLESYLQKICDQNDTMIELLKQINDKLSPANPTEEDENKALIESIDNLTKRERQIIDLVMQGMMNKQIAYELMLSISTVEAHRSNLMKKMDVKNVTQLTKKYLKFQSLRKY